MIIIVVRGMLCREPVTWWKKLMNRFLFCYFLDYYVEFYLQEGFYRAWDYIKKIEQP